MHRCTRHHNQYYSAVCTNRECSARGLVCILCAVKSHADHAETHLVSIEEFINSKGKDKDADAEKNKEKLRKTKDYLITQLSKLKGEVV